MAFGFGRVVISRLPGELRRAFAPAQPYGRSITNFGSGIFTNAGRYHVPACPDRLGSNHSDRDQASDTYPNHTGFNNRRCYDSRFNHRPGGFSNCGCFVINPACH